MPNKKDLMALFGEVPEPFADRVEQTVRHMQTPAPRAFKPRLVPMLALALVLLAGAGLALSGLGVLDSLTDNLRLFLQPGAKELVQQNIAQQGGQLPLANFTIEEALFDGRQIYFTARISPTNPAETLLMDDLSDVTTPADWWENGYDSGGQTFSNKAYTTGRDLVRVSLHQDQLEQSASTVHYDGDDLLMTYSLIASQETDAHLTMTFFTYNVFREDLPDDERRAFGELTFTVPLTDARQVYTANLPQPIEGMGIMLDRLTLEQTPIATYLTCRYSLTETATPRDGIALQDGIWTQWLDETGTPHVEGNHAGSLSFSPDGSHTQITAYRSFEEMPAEITLELFSGMTKERYATMTLPIHPAQDEKQ